MFDCNPLIRYRIHGNNQTGLMAGVEDKKSYREIRIDQPMEKFRWLEINFPGRKDLKDAINHFVDGGSAVQLGPCKKHTTSLAISELQPTYSII